MSKAIQDLGLWSVVFSNSKCTTALLLSFFLFCLFLVFFSLDFFSTWNACHMVIRFYGSLTEGVTCTERQAQWCSCYLHHQRAVQHCFGFPWHGPQTFYWYQVGTSFSTSIPRRVTMIVTGLCWLCVCPPPPPHTHTLLGLLGPSPRVFLFSPAWKQQKGEAGGTQSGIGTLHIVPRASSSTFLGWLGSGPPVQEHCSNSTAPQTWPQQPQLPSLTIVVLRPGDGYLCLISHPSLFFSLTHLVILDSNPLPQPFCIFAQTSV